MLQFMPARFATCLDSTSHRLVFTACATTPLILLIALTAELLLVQLTSRLCSDRPSQMGRDVLRQISLQRPSFYISSCDGCFYHGWVTRRLLLISSSGYLVPWSLTQSLMLCTFLFVRSWTPYWMVCVPGDSCHMPLSLPHLRSADSATTVPGNS
jgi:hypothetical protein